MVKASTSPCFAYDIYPLLDWKDAYMTSEFLGANILDDEPFIVMPWIANGNVRDYIDHHPSCDRLKLVSL